MNGSWRRTLTDRLDRDCRTDRVTGELAIRVADWASPGAASARAAAADVEPELLALLARAERIGRRRGVETGLFVALPVVVLALVLVPVVTAVLS